MSSWKNTDETSSKPKFVSTGELDIVFGVSSDEAVSERDSGNPVGHTGWVRRTTGTGGRAGRTSTEVLVAGSMSGDLEDVVMQDFNINITTQPSNHSGTDGTQAPANFVIAASTLPTGGTLTFQWQQSADSGSSWADLSVGANIPAVIQPNLVLNSDAGLSGNQYRCVVSVAGGTDAISSASTLTLA